MRLSWMVALSMVGFALPIPAQVRGLAPRSQFTGCSQLPSAIFDYRKGSPKTIIAGQTIEVFTNGLLVATYEIRGYEDVWQIAVGDDDNYQGQYNSDDINTFIQSLCPNGFGNPYSPSIFPRVRAAMVAPPPSGQAASQFVWADFNGDGTLDTAAANAGSVFITLYAADGSTISKTLYATGAPYPGQIVAADFNGDGIIDLALTILPNNPPGNVAVLLGKGDGTFSNPVMIPAGPQPLAIAAADLNGDGKPDLVVSNSIYANGGSTGTLDVLIGRGDGTFAAAVVYSAGQVPTSLIATDLNGDGKVDIAAIDSQQATNDRLLVLLGNGDGTLRAAGGSLLTGTRFGTLSYTDFNHDGKTDLAIADRQGSTLTVTMSNGDGTFQAASPYVTGAGPATAGIIPLGDGNTAVLTGDSVDGNLVVNFVGPDGTVNAPPIQPVGTKLSPLAVADLNGDGQADVVVSDSGGDRLIALLNSGGGQFANPVAYSLSPGSSPSGVAVVDVNGDGKPDLIAVDHNGIEALPGKGSGAFGAVVTSAIDGAGAGLVGPAVADFNSDGKPDAAVTVAAGQIAIVQGQGNGQFSAGATILLLNVATPIAILTGDFNGDGKADLAVGYDTQTGGALATVLGKGDGNFQAPVTINLPGFVLSLAAGDVNKDGKVDLIVGVQENTGPQVGVLLGNGDGTFQSPRMANTVAGLPSITIADLNGDGNPDLLLGDCCGLTEATYMLGKGDGTFASEVHLLSGPNPTYIGVGNLTGSNKADIAIAGNAIGHGTLVLLANDFSSTAPATVVSSANNTSATIAPGSLATAFGADLATGPAGVAANTSVSIMDFKGTVAVAPVLYGSAGQVNFLVPSTVATGAATVNITSGDGTVSTGQVQVAAIAPGLFTLNGSGLAAAIGILVSASGTQTVEQVYTVNGAGAVVAAPINLGASTDQFVLELYGTGIAAAGTSGVTVTVSGVKAQVLYAGTQGSFEGLDQVNVLLPHSLAGKGPVTIQLTAGGIGANSAMVTIQ